MEPRTIRASDRARVGSVLHDKWTLERLIGVGGMGAVYAARHRNGARAAVKVFSPVKDSPVLRERFLREGYAANKVEHAGAVKVLDDDVIDKGPDAGLAYLVMELLEGESLQERFQKDPPLGERDLLEVADGVLAVLEAAHAHGVVHRDLKPDNLFLVKDPERASAMQIKVLDFGLARLSENQEKPDVGVAFGTPTYMSPEQAAGKADTLDGRTDLYALGAILFQLSSKKRIHEAAHTLGLVVRMATTPAPKLRAVAPEVSEAFAAIVDRALAFERDDRYPTAAAMRADVQAALALPSEEPSTVNITTSSMRPPSASFAHRPTVLAEAPAETPPTPASAPVAERPRRGMLRAGLVFLAAAVLGFFAIRHRDAFLPTSAPLANVAVEDASALAPADDLDDGGDDDDAGEEDEDDDELDASATAAALDASALDAGSPRAHHAPAARPAPKRRPPRQPGTPHRKRKKRRRW